MLAAANLEHYGFCLRTLEIEYRVKTSAFSEQKRAKNLPGMLLHGPQGVGKSSIAFSSRSMLLGVATLNIVQSLGSMPSIFALLRLMEDEEYVANSDKNESRAEENAARERLAARFHDMFEQIQQYYASLNGVGLE
jgi:hypothetical protein